MNSCEYVRHGHRGPAVKLCRHQAAPLLPTPIHRELRGRHAAQHNFCERRAEAQAEYGVVSLCVLRRRQRQMPQKRLRRTMHMPCIRAPLGLVHTHLLRKVMTPSLHLCPHLLPHEIKNIRTIGQVVVRIPLAGSAPHKAREVRRPIRLVRLRSMALDLPAASPGRPETQSQRNAPRAGTTAYLSSVFPHIHIRNILISSFV